MVVLVRLVVWRFLQQRLAVSIQVYSFPGKHLEGESSKGVGDCSGVVVVRDLGIEAEYGAKGKHGGHGRL